MAARANGNRAQERTAIAGAFTRHSFALHRTRNWSTLTAPDSLESCTRRERSTTPLQALNLLNDPVFVEAAQVMAVRILREQRGSWEERLNYAFWLSLGREPRTQEKDRMVTYYQQQRAILEKKRQLADSLFPAIELEGIDPVEAAAWFGVCRLLLNLDEFITRS